jgi:hypothetical protein
MDEPKRRVSIVRIQDQRSAGELEDRTPAERIGMVWPLTLDACAFQGEKLAEARLPRHAVRLLRREG